MQFSKYLLAFVLSIVLAEATEHSSLSAGQETSKRMVSKASIVVHSHEAPRTTLKYEDYKHGYGYEYEDHDRTRTTDETTKTHDEHTKATHMASLHSMHKHKGHHNTTRIIKDAMMHLKTYTATSTAMASASYSYEASATAIYSEAPYMAADTTTTAAYSESTYMAAATTMTDSTSSEMTFDVFTLSSCTGCIMDATMTEAFGTGLITASVSAQDFTVSLSASYVSYAGVETPMYPIQSASITTFLYASTNAPSAGFATTSRAVFTGSGERQRVDFLLVAALSALVGMFMCV